MEKIIIPLAIGTGVLVLHRLFSNSPKEEKGILFCCIKEEPGYKKMGEIQFRLGKGISKGGMRITKEIKFTFKGQEYNNYVAKEYIKKDENHQLKQDVRMQFIASLYAELYNSSNPLKKIKYNKALLICYGSENNEKYLLIEEALSVKTYIKFNSNDGFILPGHNTPQCFSHFTFERSNGELLVCDIQGVKSINGEFSYTFTDPQIHTAIGGQFSGDNGYKGMRKFFNGHKCSSICNKLNLECFNSTGIPTNGATTFSTYIPELPKYQL